MLAITTILDQLTTAVLFFVDCKGCLLVLPWPLLSPRAALALVFAQAGSSIGAVVVEGPVAVHAFSPHDLPSMKVGMKSSHTFHGSLLFGLVVQNSRLGMLPVLTSCSTNSLFTLSTTSSMPRNQERLFMNINKHEEIKKLSCYFNIVQMQASRLLFHKLTE